jgi:hypothetical protein
MEGPIRRRQSPGSRLDKLDNAGVDPPLVASPGLADHDGRGVDPDDPPMSHPSDEQFNTHTWTTADRHDGIARHGVEDLDGLALGIPVAAGHDLGDRSAGESIEHTRR